MTTGRNLWLWGIVFTAFLATLAYTNRVEAISELEQCVLKAIETADDNITIGEIKSRCMEQLGQQSERSQAVEKGESPEAAPKSALTARIKEEKETRERPFVITPHRPNYILPLAYTSSPNEDPWQKAFPGENTSMQNVEVKFQISWKFPVISDIYKDNGDLYFAYTNRSIWQAYNSDISSPFRSSDHEPEAWLAFENDWEFLGFKNRLINVGAVHQSNGRAGTLSRSWNRLYATFVFERKNFYFSIKPWFRIPEDDDDDDNPDIWKYMGHGEFQGVYKLEGHTFGLLFRNNLYADENKGAIQVDWSFPLYQKIRGYVQYFNGYGESLIDYNASSNSLGVGIQLTDWL